MAIIVTGGAGFIGSNFVIDWLSQSDEVVINLDKLTYAGNLHNIESLSSNPNHIFVQGDIGNIKIDDRGKGKISITDKSGRWSIGGSPETDIIGKAIVVHVGMDDMASQPTGAAGARIGCGVIKKRFTKN